MARTSIGPKSKSLAINLDDKIYGTFAEIGAGQEVVRHFFQAGGAAGTIAKAMSAYDMIVSDSIYGKDKSGRYVSESRLTKMLDREFNQLVERLGEARPDGTRFFVFADTVAAKSYSGNRDSHGWLGMRFQHEPKSEANEVVIHVKMLDAVNLQQQEALGQIGVNLVHACFHRLDSRDSFISALMDRLSTERIKIDMIRVSGPVFKQSDSRLWCLELVKRGLCEAVMFDGKGRVLQATDELYKKNILVSRGSFRPPTLVNMDMMGTGLRKFKKSLAKEEKNQTLVLSEISMNKLMAREGQLDNEDFLARVELLAKLGQSVLISNYKHYHELNTFLTTYSKREVAFVLGYYNLEEILKPGQYKDSTSGLLGALGELIGHKTKLYIYPAYDDDGNILTAEAIKTNDESIFLLMYLIENNLIEDIEEHDRSVSHIWSRTVLKMIQDGDKAWEKMVPPSVAKEVNKMSLFGTAK
jgi:hypothetical protein